MSLSGDFIYVLTYCLFLTGSAWSFQRNAPASSIWVMSTAVFIDFLASNMPIMNLKSLAIDLYLKHNYHSSHFNGHLGLAAVSFCPVCLENK